MSERTGSTPTADIGIVVIATVAGGAATVEALLRLTAGVTNWTIGRGWHITGDGPPLVGSLLRGRGMGDAWTRLIGSGVGAPPVALWLGLTAALLLAVGVGGWFAWTRLRDAVKKNRGDARWATRSDEKAMVVATAPVSRPHRLVAGRSTSTGRLLAGHDCVSAVAFGPNGSGKTVGLIIPNVLEWAGSVVMTTAKPQDLAPVVARRRELGPVWIVAPSGAPGFDQSCWSPVDYSLDAESADRMAEWLVESSGMTGDPKARPWNAQARKYLKGLLLAAHLEHRGVPGFVDWAYEGELARETVEQILRSHGQIETLREYTSTWQIHEEGRGSVLFTAFGLADTYNRPTIRAAAARSDFVPSDLLGDRPATIVLVTPQSEADRYAPYFTALISAIVHEAEGRAGEQGGPVEPRLLLALDEAGNVFRYPRLPHLLTTGRGNGVQLLLAYHDIAQIEHLFGGSAVARTVLSNAKMRLLLPGVGDVETLRYFSDLLGQTRVSLDSQQTGPDGRRSSSRNQQRESLAPLHALQQLRGGDAVVLYENLPPARVKLRRWFADRDLQRLASPPAEEVGTWTSSTPAPAS